MQTLTFDYPPSLNHIYSRSRKGKVYLTAEARNYKTAVGWQCRAASLSPVTCEVSVTVHAYRPARRGDIDGTLKLLLDAMQGHIYKNDKQIVELHVYRHDDKRNPRVEVKVTQKRKRKSRSEG